jgi:hypothetical protein
MKAAILNARAALFSSVASMRVGRL